MYISNKNIVLSILEEAPTSISELKVVTFYNSKLQPHIKLCGTNVTIWDLKKIYGFDFCICEYENILSTSTNDSMCDQTGFTKVWFNKPLFGFENKVITCTVSSVHFNFNSPVKLCEFLQ